MTAKVLVVDDETAISTAIQAYLERDGFSVAVAADGKTALQKVRDFQPDLVVLDVMLPELDGFAVLRELRRDSNVYVLMLTAKADEIDRVLGLEMGADDYLTKPFSPRELTARVKAILRRGRDTSSPDPILTFDQVKIDPNARRVWKNREIELTPIEYDLLATLAKHHRQVLSREQLIELVWGYEYFGDERVIDVHIRRLRTKIEDDPQNPTYIVTVRGAGYRFDGGE